MRAYKPKPSFWSIAFSVAIIIYSAYKFYELSRYMRFFGTFFFCAWSYIAAIVLGGILPIILTYAMRIELIEYFRPRMIIFISTMLVVSVAKEISGMPRGALIIMLAVSAAVTLIYLYKVRPARFKEWIVIFLSTPQIYMMIYYFLLSKDVEGIIGTYLEMFESALS